MALEDARAAPREGPPRKIQQTAKSTEPRSLSKVTRDVAPDTRRRALDGPVLRDLAAATGPRIAAMDAANAAKWLAGGARDAGELRDWLAMVGLLSEAWAAPAGGRAS